MVMQAVASFTNQRSLAICEITTKEAEIAMGEDAAFDGFGVYLVSVDTNNPKGAASVLAKFASEDAARTLANFFRLHGHLEPA